MLDILFFNIKIFLQFKFQICAYTQLNSKIKKKILKENNNFFLNLFYIFFYLLNIFENNFYMVIKKLPMEKYTIFYLYAT